MKFNNRLSITDYVNVVEELASNYFNSATGEATPHIGNLYSVYVYFKYCVEPEEGDIVTQDTINITDEEGKQSIDLNELQKLFDDKKFMTNYRNAIDIYYTEYDGLFRLDFAHAFVDANEYAQNKANSAHAVSAAISNSIAGIMKAFRESFSDETINGLTELAKDIKDGKLSEEAIVEAYGNSERFAKKTQELEGSKIIKLPEKRG